MKKFLFTLSALLAFGFSANAQTAPTFAMSETEITLMPGESKEIVLSLVDRGSTGAIKGMQMDWEMLNPNGERMTSGCHLEFLEKYGVDADHWQWFGEISGIAGNTMTSRNGTSHNTTAWDEEGDYMPGNAYGVDAEIVYTGVYNYIVMNATTGICYSARLALPKDIIAFTIKADENWEDEYATFKQYKNAVSASVEVQANLMDIKIINGAKQTKAFDGVIEIGANTGLEVPITYMTNDPNAVAAVTVNGKDATVTFTVEGPDADGVYTGTGSLTLTDGIVNNVVATLTPSDDFEGEAVSDQDRFDLRKAADISIQGYGKQDGQYIIMIAPQEGAGELTYVATPTEDDVKVENGVTYLYFDMGAEPYDVTILAETAANDAFQAGEEEATITVPALDKVKTPRIWAVIDDPEDGKITVYAESTTDGATCYVVGPDNQAHEAPYTFEYDIYEGVNENWYAYATAPYMTQSDNSDAYNIFVAEQEKLYQTPDPEIVGVPDYDREVVVITVTGEGNIDVTVTGINGVIASKTGTEPVVIEVPFLEVGSDPETVSVKAVATAALPQGYDRVLPATVTEYVDIPAKQEVVPGNLQGTITFSEVNQNDGTFTVTYEGPEEGVTVTIDNYAPKAGFTVAATANGKLPEYGTYTVTATAHKADYNDLPATADLTWNAPVLEPSDPATFGTTQVTETQVIVPITGGNVTEAYYLDENGEKVSVLVDGNIVFDRPVYDGDTKVKDDYNVIVVTLDEGNYKPTETPITVTVPEILPAPEIVVTPTPVYGWYADPSGATQPNGEPVMIYGIAGYTYAITAINTQVIDGEVYYTTQLNDGEQSASKLWDPEVAVPLVGNGTWTIVAHVTKDGVQSSYDIEVVEITNDATGVSEIMNGKAVANVRYFNMAGQEMQEANGVTIVVTTYTDGTTSAVKVMK